MEMTCEAFVLDLQHLAKSKPAAFHRTLHAWRQHDRPILLQSDIRDRFTAMCEDRDAQELGACALATLAQFSQEAIVGVNRTCFVLRPHIGEWWFIAIHNETLDVESLTLKGAVGPCLG